MDGEGKRWGGRGRKEGKRNIYPCSVPNSVLRCAAEAHEPLNKLPRGKSYEVSECKQEEEEGALCISFFPSSLRKGRREGLCFQAVQA